MKILMSIKPEFAERILFGTKCYEYRRKPPARWREAGCVLLYATSPVKRVVGYCHIARILVGKPGDVWERTKGESGISRTFFDAYYKGCGLAYALEIQSPRRFVVPRELSYYHVRRPPQSYMYVED